VMFAAAVVPHALAISATVNHFRIFGFINLPFASGAMSALH
jgi:hypothetical protein